MNDRCAVVQPKTGSPHEHLRPLLAVTLGLIALLATVCGDGTVDDGTTYVYYDPVYYGSVALDSNTHTWALVTQLDNQSNADALALSKCNGAGTVVQRFTGCAAVTQSPELSLYTGTGGGQAEAESTGPSSFRVEADIHNGSW